MKTRTDNTYFSEKVRLRIDNLPPARPLSVLDMYSGNGLIWGEVVRLSPQPLKILRIDKNPDRKGLYLIGDNLKFDLDYSRFDIIDLDAYGVPFSQLERILSRPGGGQTIFITFIQAACGTIPYGLLQTLGYSPVMIRKCPTLFFRGALEKFLAYVMNIRPLTPLQSHAYRLRETGHSIPECARLMGRTREDIRRLDARARWKIKHGAEQSHGGTMITSLQLITDTVRHIIATSGFTPGERSMLLDVFNSTALDSVSIQHGAGLLAQVEDSFDLYPGVYEEKWAVERAPFLARIADLTDWQAACLSIWAVDFWRSGAYQEDDAINRYIQGRLSSGTRLASSHAPFLARIADLTDWQAACLTIWAVDFWRSGCYQEEDAVNRYIQGKLSSGTRLSSALSDITRAAELMEKTKGAFKSPAIAEARAKAEAAAKILREILD